MTIGNATVKTLHYTRDRQSIVADVTGTLPVFTSNGIMDAIEQAKASEIKIAGLGMSGVGRITDFDIGDAVTLIHPNGDTVTLRGADRQTEPR